LRAGGGVTGLLQTHPDPAELLMALLPDFQLEILEERAVAYRCTCSRERMERALVSLGAAELKSLIDGQGSAALDCRFCGKKETFTGADLAALLARAK
jgi:molecular chaperone Hsp33